MIQSNRNAKKVFKALIFAVILAQFWVWVGGALDEPDHNLAPDPHCAICQAVHAMGVVVDVQIAPLIAPQVFNVIVVYLFEKNLYLNSISNSIRGPPFQTLHL